MVGIKKMGQGKMTTLTINDIKASIKHIKEAISIVKDGELSELAREYDIWDDGIHNFMHIDVPFSDSFDEICFSDMSDTEYRAFRLNMIAWLENCLSMACNALKASEEGNKY